MNLEENLITPTPGPFLFITLLYLSVMGIIGWKSIKTTHTIKDFFIMGGRAGAIVSGFSYFATQYSMSTFMGVPGVTYANGFAGLSISVPGAVFSMLIPALLVGRKILKLGKELGFLTMSDYLAHRFDSKGIRGFHAISIIIFLVSLMGAQTIGAGIIFHIFTGYPHWIGTSIMGIVVILYCMGGGMKSAMLSDVVQGFLMVLTAVATFYLSIKSGGGIENITNTLHENHGDLYLTHPGATGTFTWPVYASMILMWSLFTIGQPILFTKFFTMKDYQTLFKAVILGTLGMLVSATLIEWAGVNAIVSLPGLEGNQTDFIVPLLLQKNLNPYIASLLVAGIFSAGMSTVDSLLVVATGGVTHDVYHCLINPKATSKQIMNVSRMTIVVIGVLGITIGILQPTSIFELIRFAFGGLGIWVAPVLLGIYWRKCTKFSVLFSMIIGECLYLSGVLSSRMRKCLSSKSLAIILPPLVRISFATSP